MSSRGGSTYLQVGHGDLVGHVLSGAVHLEEEVVERTRHDARIVLVVTQHRVCLPGACSTSTETREFKSSAVVITSPHSSCLQQRDIVGG